MAKQKGKKKTNIVVILILLVLLIGGGFFAYKIIFKKENPIQDIIDKVTEDPIPAKKLNIIDVNSDTRPYAVMINNLALARPYQSGLQDAFIVYEIVVEGGITRYLAVFKDKDNARVGSIRSARHYYLDYALENDAIYVHWGYSPQAQSDIKRLGVNALSPDNTSGVFTRDNTIKIDSEHRGIMSLAKLDAAAKSKNVRTTIDTSKMLLNYSIDAVDLSKMEGAIPANEVAIKYSNSFVSGYAYDSGAEVYKRFVNGKEHTDYVTKAQYTAKNIITYQVRNYTIPGDTKNRQELDNVGSGKGYFISNGYAVPITWSKASRSAQTVYKYNDGTEIDVNDGNTWIQIQPQGQSLSIS